ncbi:4'-phosphopantetheinyl transferase superfamily protein [Hymenobacter busanensis]|uniref:4'-phosphopantetheinyl transferase superfamily protein n=1 Tax=Hymenobacter busanensis TaxID=2607656 RepID=A0A7L5A4R0_9BACT|nr:4'-phosphopantetheinyl transferase superfamily protein [Hymenobacter busanensis]KAA9338354.1 4'-phosphopantetheinyl transferase superfamily protein [Hymenobacter busanensis]QHJ09220.1 4'-phosphopantetheinyl transferase superfamily protein [Hymenobacter busanensis]
MPLHRISTFADGQTLLGLWQLTESVEELLAQVPAAADYAALLPAGRDPQRPRQWLAGRALVHTLLPHLPASAPSARVRNDAATNQPFIESQPALGVSLSHSGAWVAALLTAEGRVGIDVELVRPKARLLAPKFLTETERADAGDDDVKYSLNWSAKETLYKLYARRRLLFKEHIRLDPYIRQENGIFTGHLLTEGAHSQHQIQYEHLTSDCVLTWCHAR